ncbi:hypothetical protein TNCV_3477671 [Trichonephila clavipes]|nr:hypothetical protein TNCV_3477671 [Trichonephila clavipes]
MIENWIANTGSLRNIARDDDNLCTAPIMVGKYVLDFDQNSKNIIDVDFDVENEMNNAAPVSTLSEMRTIMKNMHSYLDAHSDREMDNKTDNIEQFDAMENINFPKAQ